MPMMILTKCAKAKVFFSPHVLVYLLAEFY